MPHSLQSRFLLLLLPLLLLCDPGNSAARPLAAADGAHPGDHNVQVVHRTFLPVVTRDICPPFIEDFSTTANGWIEGGIFILEYGYADGEYFMRSSGAGFVSGVPAPLPCTTEKIDATVSGRWLDEPGAGFGVQFGPALTATFYYVFDVNPAAGTYRVLQRTENGIGTFIPDTPTPALDQPPPARLNVRVADGIAVLSVNGVPLEEFDYLYEGPFHLGLSIATPSNPSTLPIEARFDDVRVYGYQ